MRSFLFYVAETFDITGHGVMVTSDQTFATLGKVVLHIGDSISIRSPGRNDRLTTVAGIEHCDPWTPDHVFAILLPTDVSRSDIPIGSEVWLIDRA